jgi:hypothetical protein
LIETLEDPKVMRRYRKLVIERANFQTSSCHANRAEVFNELLREFEKERLERLRWRELAKKAPEPVVVS